MIVLSHSFVLSQVDDDDADNPIIGWDSLVTVGNIEADTEDADHPVSNLANSATHLYWLGEFTTADEQYITVTTGTVEDIDYLAVAGHNFGTEIITVSVEGLLSLGDSPAAWFELVEETILADDSPVVFRFEPQPLAQVRLRMQTGSAIPQAAVMHVGKLLVLERSIKIGTPHVPFPHGIISKEVSGKSEGGHFLGRIEINRVNESTADFEWFEPAWYRENFQPFIVDRGAFFFAWNPSEYPRECGYAWLVNNPLPEVDPVTRRVAIQLKMQGVVN